MTDTQTPDPDPTGLALLAPKRKEVKFSKARAQAALIFATTDLTIGQIAKRAEFAGKIGKVRLKRWHDEDGWEGLRARQHKVFIEKAREALGTEIVRETQRDIDTLMLIERRAIEFIADPEFVPRSWGEAANIGIQSVKLKADLRKLIQSSVVKEEKQTESAPDVLSELTEEQFAAMAKAALQAGGPVVDITVPSTPEVPSNG